MAHSADEHLFPTSAQLHRAFRGEVVESPYPDITDAATGMILRHHNRRKALRVMLQADALSCSELRRAVRKFTTAEIELAALATVVDQTIANTLPDHPDASAVWHTETVGLVISRMAELFLKYLDTADDEDQFWMHRISESYDGLIAQVTREGRLPLNIRYHPQ